MESVIQVQILDIAVCILLFSPEKGMKQLMQRRNNIDEKIDFILL